MTEKQKIIYNKKLKELNNEDLEKLDKKSLIDNILRLQSHNKQLRNLLHKKLTKDELNADEVQSVLQERNEQGEYTEKLNMKSRRENAKAMQQAKKRKFDFESCHKRHVLLKLLYFGWDYHGLASQEDNLDTIEYHLFNALQRTCLIESRATSNYQRCGRTDKEVSAFSQVISIDLRSKFPAQEQLTEQALAEEIDYCQLLNRVLPAKIRCIAWMPLRSNVYSARFDCAGRTYRYYFPQADLNIERMREAGKLLERHADFRNFCKLNVHNGVTEYVRNVQSVRIERCPNESDDVWGYTMYYLEIKANAFLWHQIRCIMAILLLIGQGQEEPALITELLDVTKNPSKPQYGPAAGLPLNLFHTEFCDFTTRKLDINGQPLTDAVDKTVPDITSWLYSQENLVGLIKTIQTEWTQHSVKTAMIRNVLHNLEATLAEKFKEVPTIKTQCLILQDLHCKPKEYQKILDRKCGESVENRIEHYLKKERIVFQNPNDTVIKATVDTSKMAEASDDMEC